MGKQEDLDSFYDIDNLVTFNITMPAQDWKNLMEAQPRGGICNFEYVGDRFDWYKATVTVSGSKFPKAAGSFSDVGIIKKSFCGSFSTTKPSIRLDFSRTIATNEDLAEKLMGTKTIILNNSIQDPAYVRQPLGYKLFHQAGLPFARCNFAKFIVNGTSMGVFVNLEPYKKQWVKNIFGNDKGNLYEQEAGEDLDPVIVASGRISFEMGGAPPAPEQKDLKLAASQIATGLAGAKQVIDYDQFLKYFAMETLLKHFDGFTTNLNNTYIYNDVVAVPNPDVSKVKLKFIPCGLDQILQEARPFEVGDRSVLARLIRDKAPADLFSAIRNLGTTVFTKSNHDAIFQPYLTRLETTLKSAGVTPTGDINSVRNQLKLIRSGAFSLIGEFPTVSTNFLTRSVGECFRVSTNEFIPPNGPNTGPQKLYHYQPTNVPEELWTASLVESRPGSSIYKFQNQASKKWLRADKNIKTSNGTLNTYAAPGDPNEGNNFIVEPSTGFALDTFRKAGYFRVKSVPTNNYVSFSDTELTPGGKKEVVQDASADRAAVLYIL